MGYCEPQWIGDYNYSKALRFRIADEGAVVADDPEVLADVKSLLVSGRVEAGTPGLEVMVSRGIPDAVAWR